MGKGYGKLLILGLVCCNQPPGTKLLPLYFWGSAQLATEEAGN